MTNPIALRLSRRRFLEGAVLLSGAALLPGERAWAESHGFHVPKTTEAALQASPLVYVSPLKSDGSESQCQAEVWFVAEGADVLVVTSEDRWRARAIGKGLDQARVWVGDFGVWKKSDGKYKTAPTYRAKAELLAKGEPSVERALELFGKKYSAEWGKWGPRFRDGIADGSRVLIRYRPAAA